MIPNGEAIRTLISHLTIFNKSKSRLDKFNLNFAQQKLLDALLEGHKRIIVVKARQLGISTLIRAYHFLEWALAKEPCKIGVIAHTQESANNLHEMDAVFLKNLPKGLQPKIKKQNTKVLTSATSGAELRAFSAGASGGTRSFVLTHAHISEFPFCENPEELLTSVLATVGDGPIIIESTPNRAEDYFHNLIKDSLEGKNNWKVLFFPWTDNKDYSSKEWIHSFTREEESLLKEGLTISQIAWRRNQISTLGKDKFFRDYPRTIEEAFRAGKSINYFNLESVDKIREINLGVGEERIYCSREDREGYFIGVDVSAGVGMDYSAITIISRSSGQPVYHYVSNKISATKLAEKLIPLGERYNGAKILVESNSYGKVVIDCLKSSGYKNLWKGKEGKDFTTSNSTRSEIFEAFRDKIEGEEIDCLDKELLAQIRGCFYVAGRPDHLSGEHDDLLMSTLLAYHCLKGKESWRDTPTNIIDDNIAKLKARRAKVPFLFQPKGKIKKHY